MMMDSMARRVLLIHEPLRAIAEQGKHDKHDALPPPLHERHDPSHASQTPPSSYLAAGHEATHSPASKYGVPEVGHVRQAVEAEPEHVRQEEAHAAHEAASFSSIWT